MRLLEHMAFDFADDMHFTGLAVKAQGQSLVSVDQCQGCLLYTSDAADERSSVDLGGRRIIKKKKIKKKKEERDTLRKTI